MERDSEVREGVAICDWRSWQAGWMAQGGTLIRSSELRDWWGFRCQAMEMDIGYCCQTTM